MGNQHHYRQYGHHGTSNARGCQHLRLGNFGKLFPDLPGLAVTEAEAEALGGPGGIMHDLENRSPDSQTPAGYTFFAQFIDHDITLDITTELHGQPLSSDAIKSLPNLRSPSLDLDCVYGFGPEASPFLYDPDAPGRLLTGTASNPDDLPRNKVGRALIGDPRNDENIFVSQLQLLFLRFHNKVLDSLVATVPGGDRFEEAQKVVRHHYQYLVVHDFLRRICHPAVFAFAMQSLANGRYPLCYRPDAQGNLPMPVEFSVAAYRFGHSLVRSRYAVNSRNPGIELFDERFNTLGFGGVPADLTVDWRFLLAVDDRVPPVCAKAVDHLLADELIHLPVPVVGQASINDRSLAFRNLLRGNVLALASGQEVAWQLCELGYPVDPRVDLDFAGIPGWQQIPVALRQGLEKSTPLFFHLLREAGVGGGEHLGPVGSAILMEVFLGALNYCETSFLKIPGWQPDERIARCGATQFSLADVVRYTQD
jgi:hypothetical protein